MRWRENNHGVAMLLKVCLHIPSPSPCLCLSPSPSKFITVPMVMDCVTDRLGSEPIQSVSVNFTGTVKEMETVGVNDLNPNSM